MNSSPKNSAPEKLFLCTANIFSGSPWKASFMNLFRLLQQQPSFSRRKTPVLPNSPVSCISMPVSPGGGNSTKIKIKINNKLYIYKKKTVWKWNLFSLSLSCQRVIALHPEITGSFWHGLAEDEAGGCSAGGWVHGGRAWQWKVLCWGSSRGVLLAAL